MFVKISTTEQFNSSTQAINILYYDTFWHASNNLTESLRNHSVTSKNLCEVNILHNVMVGLLVQEYNYMCNSTNTKATQVFPHVRCCLTSAITEQPALTPEEHRLAAWISPDSWLFRFFCVVCSSLTLQSIICSVQRQRLIAHVSVTVRKLLAR